MLEVSVVMGELDSKAQRLAELADQLAQVQRDLEPVDMLYEAFIDDFVTGLWDKHVTGEGKWPSEDVRTKLARREMAESLLGKHSKLTQSKSRLEKRISSLKTEIEARRSLLSALKVEMEAVR